MTKYLLPAFLLLLPLFWLPWLLNFFATPKFLLLILLLLALVALFVYRLFRYRQISVPTSPLILPLTLVLLTTLLAILVNPLGRTESLVGTGGILLLLSLIALFALNLPSRTSTVTTALLTSTTILSVQGILQLTVFYRLTFLPSFVTARSFTPTGSLLTTIILLALGLGLSAISFFSHAHSRRFLFALAGGLHLLALAAYLAALMPGGFLSLALLPYGASWSITLDALKDVRSFFFGIGFGNYSQFFTTVKPLFLNATPLWNYFPTSGSSELMNMLATGGILTTLSLVLLTTTGLRLAHEPKVRFTLIFTILALIFTPGSLILYTLLFVFCLAAAASATTHNAYHLGLSPRLLLASLFTLPSLVLIYYTVRLTVSEVYLRQSQLALAESNSQKLYDTSLAAINAFPWLTDHHLTFSQVNLRLASALSQKEDLSDQDRATLNQLLRQAISEGEIAAGLAPGSSTTWYNLALIYRNLLSSGDAASKKAVDYFSQAITLDRGNPALHQEYGTLYYQLATLSSSASAATKDSYLDKAVAELQTAITLKSNYASAYYYLSRVFLARGERDLAKSALETTLSFLDPTSPDYATASQELNTLKSNTATDSSTTP